MSTDPSTLNTSSDSLASFKSVFSEEAISIPMTDMAQSSELPNGFETNLERPKTWVYWTKYVLLVLLLGGILTVLIYGIVKMEWITTFHGELTASAPNLGSVQASVDFKQEAKITGSLSTILSNMEPQDSLWDQKYLDLE